MAEREYSRAPAPDWDWPDPTDPARPDPVEVGRAERKQVPRRAHAGWSPQGDRPDPIETLAAQAQSRIPELVPIRHGRMSVSPFAFFRGSAAVMADDLAQTQSTGLLVQCCGDAHLNNFGMFAAPDRRLVFDLNDFDETYVAPFEWDVKRLAASVVIAGRDNEFEEVAQRQLARAAATGYQAAIKRTAELPFLQAWYLRIDVDPLERLAQDQLTPKAAANLRKSAAKARRRTSLAALDHFAEQVDGQYRIRHQDPVIVPLAEEHRDRAEPLVRQALTDYVRTLGVADRMVVRQYHFVDIARKVSGVGSVGTDGYMVLLLGRHNDPLFLQFKEAQESVLARHSVGQTYASEGQRVVFGQRIMQTAGDSFLGYIEQDSSGRHFYVRQLRDMKGSLDPSLMLLSGLESYARLCGACLGRAHARSGTPGEIYGYIGDGRGFADAIEQFAIAYADQNNRDYSAFMAALRDGRLPVEYDV